MSRSGYVEEWDDQWALIRWRGAVKSAIRGRKGQAFLQESVAALDALSAPKLIASDLENEGEVCFLGAVGAARGIDMSQIDPEAYDVVARVFGISEALAREIVYLNDEGVYYRESPEQRFERMRAWALKNLKPTPPAPDRSSS